MLRSDQGSPPVKVGLIGRAHDKGLGIQSLEAWRGYPFEAAWVVDAYDPRFPDDPRRYLTGRPPRSVSCYPFDPTDGVNGYDWANWVDGHELDAVFSIETLYDWRIADWCRDMGVLTVVQGNPELCPHIREPHLPHPDIWAWPTSWRPTKEIPEGPLLPVPVPERPITASNPLEDRPLRVLHVGGTRALADRNGTDSIIGALRLIRERVDLTITNQDGINYKTTSRQNCRVDVIASNITDRWDLYRDFDVLVLPRRYGGLCLPALEAMASGLALCMPWVSPNDEWPIIGMQARRARNVTMKAGSIGTHDTNPRVVASMIDKLAKHRQLVADAQIRSREWAAENTWDQLRPLYDRIFRGET